MPSAIAGQTDQDLELGQSGPFEDLGRIGGEVAHRQPREGEVVVRPLQSRRSGENDIGVEAGFVQIGVDRDHEIERVERLFESPGIGRGDSRVAGDGDEQPHLALAGFLDLIGQGGDGQLPEHFRDTPAPGCASDPCGTGDLSGVDGR